ncbi:1735_t:CDS:2 [Scutellospora calospora]|uniref:1735_t:CDS:1 n=1 Tax=Scutellospora calospora TaxID=85575 RepID=A0ACA9JUV3_9GLOM|nr:1735_t:CDS:2 [Scutellospora calospora]
MKSNRDQKEINYNNLDNITGTDSMSGNIDFENIKGANVGNMKIDTDIENMRMNSEILHIQISHNINEKGDTVNSGYNEPFYNELWI